MPTTPEHWLVRLCSYHGLISLDDGDRTHCPRLASKGPGRCDEILGEPFKVMLVPSDAFSDRELKVLSWLVGRGGTVRGGGIPLQMLLAGVITHIDMAATILKTLRYKGAVTYEATTAGITYVHLLLTPREIKARTPSK